MEKLGTTLPREQLTTLPRGIPREADGLWDSVPMYQLHLMQQKVLDDFWLTV